MIPLKQSKPGDVVVIVGRVVQQNGGQTLLQWPNGQQWSMANSIEAVAYGPSTDLEARQ